VRRPTTTLIERKTMIRALDDAPDRLTRFGLDPASERPYRRRGVNEERLLAMHMTSETTTQLSPSGRPKWASPSARAQWAGFNLELLVALAACVAFWLLVGLTVYWLS
jgi:hypothetical protein